MGRALPNHGTMVTSGERPAQNSTLDQSKGDYPVSINIKVALEQVWSINDLGFIELEVVTLPSLEDEVVGPLVLSPETILFKMNAEIKRCSEHDIQFDPSDWYRMAEKLEDIAYLIEQQIEALDD